MHTDRLEKLLEFLKNEPDDPFLKYALATEYVQLNDPERALQYYEELVEKHKEYVGTYYHLGRLYEVLSRKEDAIKIYLDGIGVARGARDNHALSELQTVYNSAMGLDYEED